MVDDGHGAERISWADTAKGLIILIIVVSHAALFVEGAGYPQAALRNAVGTVTPVGMPLFFMISGMFSARYLDAPTKEFWRSRLASLAWILVIWVPIDWCLFALYPNFHDPDHGKHIWQILYGFVLPTSYLWFIWSLTAYSLVSRLLGRRRASFWLAFGAFVTAAMLGVTKWHLERYGWTILSEDYYIRGSLTFFFYFYAGYILKDRIVAFSTRPVFPAFLLLLVGFSALAVLATMFKSVALGGLVRFVAVGVGMGGAIYLGKALAVQAGVRRFFSALGAMTLPIYLTHLLFMMPIVYWLDSLDDPALERMGMVLPLTVALASTLGSLALIAIAPRLRLTLLFIPPAWWSGKRSEQPRAERTMAATPVDGTALQPTRRHHPDRVDGRAAAGE